MDRYLAPDIKLALDISKYNKFENIELKAAIEELQEDILELYVADLKGDRDTKKNIYDKLIMKKFLIIKG